LAPTKRENAAADTHMTWHWAFREPLVPPIVGQEVIQLLAEIVPSRSTGHGLPRRRRSAGPRGGLAATVRSR
jgi:hypothetical protein